VSGEISSDKHRQISIAIGILAGAFSYALVFYAGAGFWGSLVTGLAAGLAVMEATPIFLSDRSRYFFEIARRNLVRRRRNTALALAGLVVSSAIITSSLVVGTSLEATIRTGVVDWLSETDIQIYGNDPNTGQRMHFSTSIIESMQQELSDDLDLDGLTGAIWFIASASNVRSNRSLAEVGLMAPDEASWGKGSFGPLDPITGFDVSDLKLGEVALNPWLASGLEANLGDVLRVGWTDIDENGTALRQEANATVGAILSEYGPVQPAGPREPAMYARLSDVAEWKQQPNTINRILISATGGPLTSLDAEKRLAPRVKDALDKAILTEDAGLEFMEVDGVGISISRSDPLHGLPGSIFKDAKEEIEDGNLVGEISEGILVPLASISHDGFEHLAVFEPRVEGVVHSQGVDWFYGTTTLTLRARSNGDLWTFSLGNNAAIDDFVANSTASFTLSDGQVHIIRKGDERAGTNLARAGLLTSELILDGEDTVGLGWIGEKAVALVRNGTSLGLAYISEDRVLTDRWNLTLPDDVSSVIPDLREISISGTALEPVMRLRGLGLGSICIVDAPELHESDLNVVCTTDNNPGLRWPVSSGVPFVSNETSLIDPTNRINSLTAQDFGGDEIVCSDSDSLIVASENGATWTFFLKGLGGATHVVDVPESLTSQAVSECSITDSGSIVSLGDRLFLFGHLSESLIALYPWQLSIDGLGRSPLFLAALSQNGTDPVEEGLLHPLEFSRDVGFPMPGRTSRIEGLIPAAAGLDRSKNLVVSSLLPPPAGLSSSPASKAILGWINLSDAAYLGALESDDRSQLSVAGLVDSSDIEAWKNWTDEIADAKLMGLKVKRSKADAIESAELAADGIASTFLIFGTFTIVAGVLLVLLVFVLVVEERRTELGMLRAIGMSRSELRQVLALEGGLLALVASAIGSLLGIVIAWSVIAGLGAAFSDIEAAHLTFAVEYWNPIVGFAGGFLATWLSLLLAVQRIVLTDVVAVLRGLPRNVLQRRVWWMDALSLFFFISGLTLLSIGKWHEFKDFSMGHSVWIGGGALLLLGMSPLFELLVNRILPEKIMMRSGTIHRTSLARRFTGLLLGVLMISWLIDPFEWDHVRSEYSPGEISFVIFGLGSVAGAVLVALSLSGPLAGLIRRLFPRNRSITLPAFAHPLAQPVRTGVILGMFSLVLFSSVILVGFVSQFQTSSEGWVDDSSGDFELLIRGTTRRPITLEANVDALSLAAPLPPGRSIDAAAVISYQSVRIVGDTDSDRIPYALRGMDSSFSDHGGLPLSQRSPEYATDADAWAALAENPTAAIVDSFLAPIERDEIDDELLPYLTNLHGQIEVSDRKHPEIRKNLTVIAVLSPNAQWGAGGIWVAEDTASETFDSRPTRIYVSLDGPASLSDRVSWGEALEEGIAEHGHEVNVIEADVLEFTSILISILRVFQAYLSLGILVGAAGLGVVTLRAVSERRHQVGVMRAVGYKRNDILKMFFLEIGWLAGLGLLLGIGVGLGFHKALYVEYWEPDGVPFVIPWYGIGLIVLSSILLVLAAVSIPVRDASRVHPAEALRMIES